MTFESLYRDLMKNKAINHFKLHRVEIFLEVVRMVEPFDKADYTCIGHEFRSHRWPRNSNDLDGQ